MRVGWGCDKSHHRLHCVERFPSMQESGGAATWHTEAVSTHGALEPASSPEPHKAYYNQLLQSTCCTQGGPLQPRCPPRPRAEPPKPPSGCQPPSMVVLFEQAASEVINVLPCHSLASGGGTLIAVLSPSLQPQTPAAGPGRPGTRVQGVQIALPVPSHEPRLHPGGESHYSASLYKSRCD